MGTLLSTYRPLWTDNLLAKRRRAAYGGTVGPGEIPMGLRMQPRSEKSFTLISKAGPNVVESAASLTEFVPFRRSGALGYFDTL